MAKPVTINSLPNLTLTVRITRRLRWRIKIVLVLLRLISWIAPFHVEVVRNDG